VHNPPVVAGFTPAQSQAIWKVCFDRFRHTASAADFATVDALVATVAPGLPGSPSHNYQLAYGDCDHDDSIDWLCWYDGPGPVGVGNGQYLWNSANTQGAYSFIVTGNAQGAYAEYTPDPFTGDKNAQPYYPYAPNTLLRPNFAEWQGTHGSCNGAQTFAARQGLWYSAFAAELGPRPPTTTVDSGPASPTTSPSATFSFSGTDDVTPAEHLHFACRLDGGAFVACTSPQTYAALPEGSHTFQVQAMNAAGTVDPTPASFTWLIDLTAPAVLIDSMPLDPTNSTSATFAFHAAEANSTLACSLDGGAFGVCLSPQTYDALRNGPHTFAVWVRDAAGNQGNAVRFAWVIDTQAPETLIDTAPAPIANSNTAFFTFHATEGATFTCQREHQPPAACTSPLTYTGLADGQYSLSVTARDPVGNTDPSPAIVLWEVETVAPDTRITAGPAARATATATTATFTFTGTDNRTAAPDLTFECSLDGAVFRACTSGVTYRTLSQRRHTLAVRAQDQAGNRDPSPASRTWTVGKRTPVLTWANPADITYPTALSGTQLHATADIAGTFVYTPAAGTILPPGPRRTLSVLFIPNDTTSYSPARTTVHLNVLKGGGHGARHDGDADERHRHLSRHVHPNRKQPLSGHAARRTHDDGAAGTPKADRDARRR
jgi:hypothetical protein